MPEVVSSTKITEQRDDGSGWVDIKEEKNMNDNGEQG